MTIASDDSGIAYRWIRNTAGVYLRNRWASCLEGAGRFAFVSHLLARETSFANAGAVLDSLILDEDGGIRTLVTAIFEEERIWLVNASEDALADLLAAAQRELNVDELELLADRPVAAVAVEGPEAWRVAASFVDSDIASLLLGTYIEIEKGTCDPEAGLLARTGATAEFGYLIFVPDGDVEDLMRLVSSFAESLQGGTVTRSALLRAQVEVSHPVIPEQTSGLTVREAGLTWLSSPTGDRDFRGASSLRATLTPTRRTIAVTTDGEDLPEDGAPVYAGGQVVGTLQYRAPRCGQPFDLGLVVLEQPFGVPGLSLACGTVPIRTVARPVIEPMSWSRSIEG